MSARSFAAVMAALGVIALLGFGLIAQGGSRLVIGEPAPDEPLPLLDGDRDGEGEGRLSDHRGSWVLVNFWASWCKPCETESPAIERYARDHRRDGLVVLGVNTRDTRDDAREFIEELSLSWEMLRDGDGRHQDLWGLVGLPESFLVDPDGNLALIRRGGVDRDYLDQHVTPLITGERPAS